MVGFLVPNGPSQMSPPGWPAGTARGAAAVVGQSIPAKKSRCEEGGTSSLPRAPVVSRHSWPLMQVPPGSSSLRFLEIPAEWIVSALGICFGFPFAARN